MLLAAAFRVLRCKDNGAEAGIGCGVCRDHLRKNQRYSAGGSDYRANLGICDKQFLASKQYGRVDAVVLFAGEEPNWTVGALRVEPGRRSIGKRKTCEIRVLAPDLLGDGIRIFRHEK
jgi:hypothetical protein